MRKLYIYLSHLSYTTTKGFEKELFMPHKCIVYAVQVYHLRGGNKSYVSTVKEVKEEIVTFLIGNYLPPT